MTTFTDQSLQINELFNSLTFIEQSLQINELFKKKDKDFLKILKRLQDLLDSYLIKYSDILKSNEDDNNCTDNCTDNYYICDHCECTSLDTNPDCSSCEKSCCMKLIQASTQNEELSIKNGKNDSFRNDTKVIFQCIQNTFANETNLRELEDDDSDDDDDYRDDYDDEIKKFKEFINNISFILNNIDTVDLIHPDNDFKLNCFNAIQYLKQKQESVENLNKTMKEMSSTLKDVEEMFKKIANT